MTTTDQVDDYTVPKNSILGSHVMTRVFSFVALSSAVAGCGYLGREGYLVVTDDFIAPAILSPDSDIVVDAKLKISQITLEKSRASSATEEADADIEAAEKAIVRLNELKQLSGNSLTWSKVTTAERATSGSVDLQTLAAQKSKLEEMVQRQQSITKEAKDNLSAGLALKEDVEKEEQQLNSLHLALFDNERSRIQSSLLSGQAAMASNALRSNSKSLLTNDMMFAADMQVRIETQLLASEAELRSKMAARNQAREELDKISQLETDLYVRPLFKAISQTLPVAFAPYSQLKTIRPDQPVMDCVLAIFNCKEVGRVHSIVKGEAIMADPFSSGQTRGQFITLEVNDSEALQSKVLRVRPESKNFLSLNKWAQLYR